MMPHIYKLLKTGNKVNSYSKQNKVMRACSN